MAGREHGVAHFARRRGTPFVFEAKEANLILDQVLLQERQRRERGREVVLRADRRRGDPHRRRLRARRIGARDVVAEAGAGAEEHFAIGLGQEGHGIDVVAG